MRNEIGLRIAMLREEKGLSQKGLSEELKKLGLPVKRETVTQWENGTRDLKTEYTIKLAEFFHVSSDYLLGLSNVKARNETIQGIHDITGLWEDAIIGLRIEKSCGDWELSEFISYLTTHEQTISLVRAIKIMNKFRGDNCDKTVSVDTGDPQSYDVCMSEVYKLIVNDLLWKILDDYTTKPNEQLVGRKVVTSNKGRDNG